MKTQSGFTLIELVVVIVILGILAAFAVPRFVALDQQARIAAVNGLAGSMRASAALAHGMYLATGTSPGTITMEGQTITMTFGYPDGLTAPSTLNDTSGFTATTAAGSAVFKKSGAPSSGTNCSVTYTAATSATVPATVAVDVSNC
jgi:MSHA pilin protein MshA